MAVASAIPWQPANSILTCIDAELDLQLLRRQHARLLGRAHGAPRIALMLVTPVDGMLRRFGRIALQLAALSGFGIAATSLVALLVSEQTELFGLMESNYRPAIIVAIASEAAAAVLLAPVRSKSLEQATGIHGLCGMLPAG